MPSSTLNSRVPVSLPTMPAWARSATVRRAIAAALVVLAALSAIRGDPSGDSTVVIVSDRELRPGYVITDGDVRAQSIATDSVPTGATVSTADVVGRTVAGPINEGETFTDARLLGPRLVAATYGADDGRVVPIRVADAALADVVRAGDLVDVLTVTESVDGSTPPAAKVLAVGATVVLVPEVTGGVRARDRLVLLALGTEAATTVAAASLISALTLTLH